MSDTEPGVVRLRTRAEVPEPLVKTALITLARLDGTDPIAFFEAVELARDPAHVPFGNTAEILRGYDFLDGEGRMHGATRDVILAATDGTDFFRIVSPYAGDPTTEAK